MSTSDHIDLFNEETQEDWFPTYKELRDEFPIYQIPGSKIYVLTRYEDVIYVIRHPERFINGYGTTRHPSSQKIYEEKGFIKRSVLGTNPPVHKLYRDMVDSHFNVEGSARWK